MIDTDTRQLRRDSEGFFYAGAGKRPCDHCGHRAECPMVNHVMACREFLPVIPFKESLGLDRVANTIRLGRAWLKRLDVGDWVALYNPDTRKIFGHAQTLALFAGPIAPMLRVHAAANHLMLDRPTETAAVELAAYLRRTYGPRLVKEDRQITAMYVLRRRESAPAPNFEIDEENWPFESRSARARQDLGDRAG